MAEMAVHDHAAGLRFGVPGGWEVHVGELMGPFTCVALRPELDLGSPEAQARAAEEERRLWELATRSYWAEVDPGDDLSEDGPGIRSLSVGTGTLDGTDEEPPTEDELVDAAEWLVTTFGALFDCFPEDPVLSETRDQRRFEVDGLAAAEVSYGFVAGPHGRHTAYLRAVVVSLPDGRTSFALGIATPHTDRAVVDAILDELKPLP